MRRAQRIEKVEARLLFAAAKARAKGIAIVCEAFDLSEEPYEEVDAVCVLGAASRFRVKLGLSTRYIASEWDSIEMGFDGVALARARRCCDAPLDVDFYRLGKRLRERLRPVRACLLRRPS